MKWTNRGHEYDQIKSIIESDNKCFYIWGAGTFGYAFFEQFSDKIRIEGFIDRNEKKQGTLFCGKKVISPEAFREIRKNEMVIVSTGMTKSVYEILNKWGYKRFEDYCHIDEWTSLYSYFVENKVVVSDLTLQITQKCTLKCEYCNAFIPLLSNPKDVLMDRLMKELDIFFSWVDEVNVVGIGGGDAMCNMHFNDILQCIAEKYYPRRIKHLEVYSNAVIVPSKETLELFKKYNVIYRFTDYYGHSEHQKADEVQMLLLENGIMCDRVMFDQWYDSGYPQVSNGILTEEGLVEFCTECDRKTCHVIYNGHFFTCGMCQAAASIDYCEIVDTDYFDMNNVDYTKLIEFIEYYLGFSERGYYNYCKKCNGGLNVNKFPINVGMQN